MVTPAGFYPDALPLSHARRLDGRQDSNLRPSDPDNRPTSTRSPARQPRLRHGCGDSDRLRAPKDPTGFEPVMPDNRSDSTRAADRADERSGLEPTRMWKRTPAVRRSDR
ncbi:hypothetical protein GCM10017600_87170 [Streptosporangium carneum]|uniref:Uncharacterized protein n=1 Tax=Streptosporangium carneum TaxID=47481 RepID=A0A9W6ID04_9ACTN|nr:hypothetical protein GCM10017600_87170 [Streptosporangium carneum]